ncbi:MAG: hypothetical protein KKD44_19365 [Proteobacteria bacterium]|nr:hypothetical protein [Pseudomonadota bacterium]
MTQNIDQPQASLARRIAGLVAGIAIILIFMLVIAPYMDDKPFIKPLVDFIEYRDIDASALYYTEIEEFSHASVFMDNSRRFSPKPL